MKQTRIGWRSSALRSLYIASACAFCTVVSACQLKVTDGTGSGGSADGLGGAPGNGTSTGAGGISNGAAQGGSGGSMLGQSGGSTSSAGNVEDCTHPDAIPSDREHAVNFGSGATICVKDSDDDWFYVDAPSDNRAHVIKLDIAETAGSWVNFSILADNDGSDLGSVHPSQRGLKTSTFVTVGPGTRTFFDFNGFVENNTDTTTIKVSVSTEADEHEPNNERASASPIQIATEVTAQLLMPYVSQTNEEMQDWYKADLSAGKHTFQVSSVPSDLLPEVQVSDSNGVIIGGDHGPNRGATFSFTFTAEQAGTYYFRVESFIDVYVVYTGNEPDSFTQPYKFRID